MKYSTKFKKDVRSICKMLREEFYVHEREFFIKWQNSNEERDDGRRILASIPIDNRYLTFTVDIYPALEDKWKEDKAYLLKTLVHEFSHLITEPLYDFAIKAISQREQDYLEDVREQQTERIAIILTPFLEQKMIKKFKHDNKKPRKRVKRK